MVKAEECFFLSEVLEKLKFKKWAPSCVAYNSFDQFKFITHMAVVVKYTLSTRNKAKGKKCKS